MLNVPSSPALVLLATASFSEKASTQAPAAPGPLAGVPPSTVPAMVARAGALVVTPLVRCGAVTWTSRGAMISATAADPVAHGNSCSWLVASVQATDRVVAAAVARAQAIGL